MSKEISVKQYVCPNCDVVYPSVQEAEDCIRNHDFPKKIWVDLMVLERDNIDNYLENMAANLLGLSKTPYQGDEDLSAEGFADAFRLKFLVEVNKYPPSVRILEARPLGGLGYLEKYIINVGHSDIFTQIIRDNHEILEAFKQGDERIMAKIVERDGCPLCFKKKYPCGCWD